MNSGIKFKCCDMPEANEFTIHIFGALAQQQRQYISDKTKKGLAVAKEKGVKLGKPENMTTSGRAKGQQANKINARNRTSNKVATEIIMFRVGEKKESYLSVAKRLNELGLKTVRSKQYTAMTVSRLYKRYIQDQQQEQMI